VDVRFHRRVQSDLGDILEGYFAVSEELGYDFFAEFTAGVARACANPRFFHFEAGGLRRCNLERFPYHFLYDLYQGPVRIWVLRHDHGNQRAGTRSFRP